MHLGISCYALEKVDSHLAMGLCDSYTSLVLSNLSLASMTGQMHANHKPILLLIISAFLEFVNYYFQIFGVLE